MSDLLAMQRAVWRSGRTTTEKIVLLAIIDYYSESSQQPWPSVPTLSKRTSLGRTAVLDAIGELERDGVLIVRREHGRPNRYDLSRLSAALAAVRGAEPSATRTTSTPAIEEGARSAHSKSPEPIREADPSANQTAVQTSASKDPCARLGRAGPVHEATPSDTRTGPPGEHDPSASRTSPVRQADPKEPRKEPKMEASRTRAGATTRLDEVSVQPIAQRARAALVSRRDAQRLQPQDWPEVRQIVEAFASTVGRERPLGEFARDSGLRAIVGLLAAGNSVEDVEWVAENVPKQAWWRSDGRTRGLATLSPEVVARALEERDSAARAGLRVGGRTTISEERRIHRNSLLTNAESGRYGSEVQARARSGISLRELADELERQEARGEPRYVTAGARNGSNAPTRPLAPLAKAPAEHLDAGQIAELVAQIKSAPGTSR
jgi:hypothetical protein